MQDNTGGQQPKSAKQNTTTTKKGTKQVRVEKATKILDLTFRGFDVCCHERAGKGAHPLEHTLHLWAQLDKTQNTDANGEIQQGF